MLTREGCIKRRNRLWSELPESIEWVLIGDPRHVNYFSGFWINPLSFSHNERAFLLLQRDRTSALFADNFTLASAAGEYFTDTTIPCLWYDKEHSVHSRDNLLIEALAEAGSITDGAPGLAENEWIPLQALDSIPGLRTAGDAEEGISLGSVIRELRRVKDDDEISLLRRCMKAGDAGHKRALEVVRPGIRELDVYLEVQKAAVAALGAPGIVYGDFRAVNAEAPKQSGLPTEYILQEGDLFILDYSVVWKGYRSDTTNTIAAGEPTKAQKKLFHACLNALTAGEKILKSGISAKDIFHEVTNTYVSQGYPPPPPRHQGHGLGLSHPEPPILVSESDDFLKAGDVITLEPAGHIPGTGGVRVEHNYLITETGYTRLSGHELKFRG